MYTDAVESLVNRAEFNAVIDEKYPPGALTKTMRVERRDRVTEWLRGIDPPPEGSWKYRIIKRGYQVVSFPHLGEEKILCLKGPMQNGQIEQGLYGEWRKVLGVEEFYDILLDTHVRVLNHGGHRMLMKAVEKDYTGMPRFAARKFIGLCQECIRNPRHKLLASARKKKVVRLGAITRDFNRRCQVDVVDLTLCPDGQYTHVGLYTDHWTKFVTLFPMTGDSPQHVAYGLTASVYPYYGPPHFLHASQGKEFAEKVVQLSIDKWKGGERTVCPRGKGALLHMGEAVERTKELLISLISARVASSSLPEGPPLSWATWLGSIMYDINNQQNESTGKSPYKRVFERTLVSSPDTADSSTGSGKRSSGAGSSRKRRPSSSDDASIIMTSHKTPQPVGAAKLRRPSTFVAIENRR